jgi:hypothetical protein
MSLVVFTRMIVSFVYIKHMSTMLLHHLIVVTSLPTVSAGFLHVGIETHIDKDPDVVRMYSIYFF